MLALECVVKMLAMESSKDLLFVLEEFERSCISSQMKSLSKRDDFAISEIINDVIISEESDLETTRSLMFGSQRNLTDDTQPLESIVAKNFIHLNILNSDYFYEIAENTLKKF